MRKNLSFAGTSSTDLEERLCQGLQFGDIYFQDESEPLESVCGIELSGAMSHLVLHANHGLVMKMWHFELLA